MVADGLGLQCPDVFEELLREWDGEEAVVRFDRDSGAWMFVCIHSTVRGPAGGGTRMRVYDEPSDGLADAMRLSAAMTQEDGGRGHAARRREGRARRAGAAGGRRAAAAAPPLRRSRRVARRHVRDRGRHEHLAGRPRRRRRALLTGVRDDRARRQQRPRDRPRGAPRDPRERRARLRLARISAGARCSCRVSARSAPIWPGGSPRTGARVLVTDLDAELAGRVAGKVGAAVVAADAALTTDCDVYAPCAVGGTLNADSIPRLRCRIVAGCAEQPARHSRGRRPPARGRDPLRPRLRHQRRRRPPAARPRVARLGRRRARAAPRRDRRHAAHALPGGRRGGDHAGGRGGAARREAAQPSVVMYWR